MPHRQDALLTAAGFLARAITLILALALGAVLVGTGVLLTMGQGELWRRIEAAEAPAIAFWAVIASFGIIAAAVALAIPFFTALRRIIRSVDEGDPFAVANAQRLRRMGWLAVANQLLMLPLAALGNWLAPYLDRLDERYHADLGLDPAAILLILVLFILARVFERGAALQADIEGTV